MPRCYVPAIVAGCTSKKTISISWAENRLSGILNWEQLLDPAYFPSIGRSRISLIRQICRWARRVLLMLCCSLCCRERKGKYVLFVCAVSWGMPIPEKCHKSWNISQPADNKLSLALSLNTNSTWRMLRLFILIFWRATNPRKKSVNIWGGQK